MRTISLRWKHIIALALISFSAHNALADTGNFYSGVDVGKTDFSGDGPRDTVVFKRGQQFSDGDTTYGIHAGYNITHWFATEIAYTDFGSATDTFALSPDIVFIGKPVDTQSVSAKGATLSAVFNYELLNDFSVFAVVGVSAINYDIALTGGFSEVTGRIALKGDESDQGLVYGIGAKYALSDKLNLRADARRNEVGDFTLDSITAGLEFNF